MPSEIDPKTGEYVPILGTTGPETSGNTSDSGLADNMIGRVYNKLDDELRVVGNNAEAIHVSDLAERMLLAEADRAERRAKLWAAPGASSIRIVLAALAALRDATAQIPSAAALAPLRSLVASGWLARHCPDADPAVRALLSLYDRVAAVTR